MPETGAATGSVPAGIEAPGSAGGVAGAGTVGDAKGAEGPCAEGAFGGVAGFGRPAGRLVGAPRPTRRGGAVVPEATRWTLVEVEVEVEVEDVNGGAGAGVDAAPRAGGGESAAAREGRAGPAGIDPGPLAPPTGRTGPLGPGCVGGITGTGAAAVRRTSVEGV